MIGWARPFTVRRTGGRSINRTIPHWPPPSRVNSSRVIGEPSLLLAPPNRSAKRPTRPRIIVNAESPRPRTSIVMASIPRTIVIPCPVHHRPAIDKASGVACGVPDIHDGRSMAVHAHVTDVVDGIARRNRVNGFGNTDTNRPRSKRARTFKPHSIITIVVSPADANDRRLRVHGVLHARVLDRLKLRIPIVLNVGRRRRPVHFCRLWDLRIEHSLPRRGGSGDA
jgi:hypothetical protein